MFDFLSMANNYEERKVNRYDKKGLFVDTCLITDQPEPYEYETAISHKEYNEGELIVVELYKTKGESTIGHKKWVKIMISKNLPEKLIDVSNIVVTQYMDELGKKGKNWRIYKRCKENDKNE